MNFKKLPPYFFPALIFVSSFLLRMSLISKGPFNIDTLNLIMQSEKTLETFTLHHLFGTGYPMVVVIGTVFLAVFKIFGFQDPAFAINFSSVFFSSLCVLFFYLISRTLMSEGAAFLGSIILSVCPTFLDISIYGMSHAPALFFVLLTFWAIIGYRRNFDQKYIWLAGISLGFSAACRIQEAFLLLPALCYLLFAPFDRTWPEIKTKEKIIQLIKILIVFSMITVFFYGLLIFIHRETYLDQLNAYLHLESNQWRNNLKESFEITLLFLRSNFSVGGLIIFALGLRYLFHHQRHVGMFVLLWIIFPLCFFGQLWSTTSRYFTILIPAMIMAQGYLLAKFSQINRTFLIVSMLAFLQILFIPLWQPFKMFQIRHAFALVPDYARWIGQKTKDNAVIVAGDEALFISYYAKRAFMSKPTNAYKSPEELKAFKDKVDELLNDNKQVYFTCLGLDAYDEDMVFRNYVSTYYELWVVGSRPYEGWHTSPYANHVFDCPLIKAVKKPQPK